MRLCPNWPSISDICIECLIPLRQVIWGDIWKCTPVKAKQMQPLWLCILSGSQVCDTFETQWTKIHISTTKDFLKYTCYACGCGILISQVTQMQSVWLLIFSSWHFEGTFSNTQWGEVKQMQLMWLCILSDKRFENTFKNITRGETSKDITSFSILTHLGMLQHNLTPHTPFLLNS